MNQVQRRVQSGGTEHTGREGFEEFDGVEEFDGFEEFYISIARPRSLFGSFGRVGIGRVLVSLLRLSFRVSL